MDLENTKAVGSSANQAENYAAPPGFGTFWVWELDSLKPGEPFANNNSDGLQCHAIGEAEADSMQTLMDATGNYEPQAAHHRLELGRRGYMGELESDLVTYGWVAFKFERFGDTGVGFEVAPGSAYLYDFATLPQQRGHGYYPTLLRFVVTDLARLGLKRAWISTAPGNDKSARSIGRAGFQKVAHTQFVPGSPPRFELSGVAGTKGELLEAAQAGHVSL